MPPKWDEEEDSSAPSSPRIVAAPRRRFDDEEDEDDVLDSWDAEDSEAEREKEAKAAAAKAKAAEEAAAKKKPKSQRIAEHQEAARRRREELEDETSDEDEDEEERRERLKRSEKDSDLKHAEDLFGDIDLNKKRSAPKAAVISDSSDPTKSIDLSALPLFKPTTKTQFTQLTTTIAPLLAAQSKKPQYSLWVQDFARQLVKELPSHEIKKVASALTAAGNEKMKEEKAAEKGGKKTKAAKTKTSLVGSRSTVDTTAYDGDELDDDDFM